MNKKAQEGTEKPPRITQSPNGPDIVNAVIAGIVTGGLVIFAVGTVAMARDMLVKTPTGQIYTERIPSPSEDPTPFDAVPVAGMADGPDGVDPSGRIDRGCNAEGCWSACERGLVNPFCTVVNADCIPGEAACACTYFCARDGNGVQWTPGKEFSVSEGNGSDQ